jgi:hypothetical protein
MPRIRSDWIRMRNHDALPVTLEPVATIAHNGIT